MAELLTMKIVKEYQNRVTLLPDDGRQDIGERRTLRLELQARCNLTEIQALNILNGFHIKDYIAICKRGKEDDRRKKADQDT